MILRRTSSIVNELEIRLRRYEEELEQLKSENEYLRRSAESFGELAERLNCVVRRSHSSSTTVSTSTIS
jgi:prefoldin subunit 5